MILVGESGVGKTNLLSRFAFDEFNIESRATIGVEFSTRNIKVENTVIKAQVWDTAGQEKFRAVTNAYYHGSIGAMIVYAVNDRNSFDRVEKWLEEVKKNADPDVLVMVIGNKSDLDEARVVATTEGEALAEKHGFLFMETSAKSSRNVDRAFTELVKGIYEAKKSVPSGGKDANITLQKGQTVSIDTNNGKGGCC